MNAQALVPIAPSAVESPISVLLREYHDLELRSHVSLDDVISKVTQEVAELTQAALAEDAVESRKEAADVVSNVLSASARLGAIPSEFCAGRLPGPSLSAPSSAADLLRSLGVWNQTVQALRGRYVRNVATVDDLRAATRSLVDAVLPFASAPAADLVEGMLATNVAKFRSRVDAYKPDISLDAHIRACPDFPKPGIVFRDISPLLADPEAMRFAAFELAYQCRDADVIAGLDARGFLFGMAVAEILAKPFVMIRKKGKLPGDTVGADYSLEYGDSSIEIQCDAVLPGQNVAIVDDLLATGGTFAAAASLVEKVGGKVVSLVSVIALDDADLVVCPARQSIEKYRTASLVRYG